MPIIRPIILPTVAAPKSITARRRNSNMLNPSFYEQDNAKEEESKEDQQQAQSMQSMTAEYIQGQLAKMRGRQAPPKLEPGTRVRAADPTAINPGTFQQYYQRLGSIDQLGQEALNAAQARAAFQRMQTLNSVGQQSQGQGSTGGTNYGPTGSMPAPGNINETQAIVKDIAAKQFGWSGAEWDALYGLIQRESGWRANAANPTSAARGLFQKMVNIHGPIESTVQGQAMWGLNYIRQRYGSPSRALAHWLRRVPINGKDVGNWY